MSEKTFEMTMLFDFYGEFLTDKQKEYFDLYYNEDLTLSEIAETNGITRQGVRDNLHRAEKTLLETERRIGLVKKFGENRRAIYKIESCARDIIEKTSDPVVMDFAEEIIHSLENLKY